MKCFKELIDGNDAAFDLYGYSREEFLNLTYWDITAEPEKTKGIFPRVLSGEVKRIPLRYQKKKNGTVIPMEGAVCVCKLNNRKVICGVTTDISEHLESQDKLKKINQELRDEIQNREQAEAALSFSEVEDQITTAKERTLQALKDVKNISLGLRPSMIDTLGLVPSLRELFNEIQKQTDIEINFFSRMIPKQIENARKSHSARRWPQH